MTIAAMYLMSLWMSGLSLMSMLDWIFMMTDLITIVVHHMLMHFLAGINAVQFFVKH